MDKKEVNVVVDGIQVKYKEGVLSYQSTVTTQHEEKNVEEQSAKSNELVIPRGGENTVILADGTTVHLNAGSKLTYPVRFVSDARIGRGDGREDALDLDLIVGHDDENIVLAVIQQRRQVARIVGGTVRRVHISIGILPVVGIAQQGVQV